jgi:hypothetical protein
MLNLLITGLKSHTRSADGSQVTLIFETKYIGDLELTMSAASFDAAVANLAGATAAPKRKDSAAPTARTDNPKGNVDELAFKLPKTWLVAAELQKRGLVLVVFNHQSEDKVGYALSPEAATEIAAGLTKNAQLVANSNALRPTAQKPAATMRTEKPTGNANELPFTWPKTWLVP